MARIKTSPNRAGVAEPRLTIWDKILDKIMDTNFGQNLRQNFGHMDKQSDGQMDRRDQI